VKLLNNGTGPHTSAQIATWVQKGKWEVLQLPPHSLDLAPSDFYLYRPFKCFLSGKRFEDQTVLQKIVVRYFTSFGNKYCPEEVFKLVKCWDKCLNAIGDQVEK
jgi:hypothetical protein